MDKIIKKKKMEKKERKKKKDLNQDKESLKKEERVMWPDSFEG